MFEKPKKTSNFFDSVYEEINSIVDAFKAGSLESPGALKFALAEALTVIIKQSFINGIEVGKKTNQKPYVKKQVSRI